MLPVPAIRPAFMRATTIGVILALAGAIAHPVQAQSDDDIRGEYRITVFPAHPLSKSVTAFGYLGLVFNPDINAHSYYLGFPGISWHTTPWMDLWGGLIGVYNDNTQSASTYELRPFFGPKFQVPKSPVTPFIWPRFEWRNITNTDTDVTDSYWRVRVRMGLEIPLSEQKYKPGTLYALTDVEPFYRFDKNYTDQLRWRMALGWVVNGRLRMEFQYYMQFGRADGEALHHNANIFRLNFKLGSKHGVLGRVFGFDE